MASRLLIVDDNPDIAELITEFVSDLFEQVDTVPSVDSAIKNLDENAYSLIFLDLNLANRNGAEVIRHLIDTENHPNNETPLIIISGIITPQFIDKYSRRFAGVLMKPFDQEDIRKISEEILGIREAPEIKNLAEVPLDEITNMKCELPSSLSQLEQRVQKRLEQFKKGGIKKKLAQLKIDRTEENYYSSHIELLNHVSLCLSVHMEWNTDKTLEKFIYASYLHDMALRDRPEYLKINSVEELDKIKSKLTKEEYRFVLEHPTIAANSIESIKSIPTDVPLIIKQHHELPIGGGFPTGCSYNKITAFSAVFIVAHDFTDYILLNPKFSMEEYIKSVQDKFKSAIFIKILQKLPKIK